MTLLSVNINKIALLRNSRGRNYPDVDAFAARFLDLGAAGITLHPRQDQRHARYSDVESLGQLCQQRGAELNVEGYPARNSWKSSIAIAPRNARWCRMRRIS
jgi:pyridoxine 5-phosphate synthase